MNRHGAIERNKHGGDFFDSDGSEIKEEQGITGRAQDEAKVRKAVPQVTCAGADARVWITSAHSPNRCGLLACESCKQVGRLGLFTHKTVHALQAFALNSTVIFFLSVCRSTMLHTL